MEKTNQIEQKLKATAGGMENRKSKNPVFDGCSMFNNALVPFHQNQKYIIEQISRRSTSPGILFKTEESITKKPSFFIVHIETKDLTNDMNCLSNVKPTLKQKL